MSKPAAFMLGRRTVVPPLYPLFGGSDSLNPPYKGRNWDLDSQFDPVDGADEGGRASFLASRSGLRCA